MINNKLETTTVSRFAMPVSGHPCALGMTDREAVIVRDRAFTGAVQGLPVYVVLGDAFPVSDAWSPPI
jgi:hypothetical protein